MCPKAIFLDLRSKVQEKMFVSKPASGQSRSDADDQYFSSMVGGSNPVVSQPSSSAAKIASTSTSVGSGRGTGLQATRESNGVSSTPHAGLTPLLGRVSPEIHFFVSIIGQAAELQIEEIRVGVGESFHFLFPFPPLSPFYFTPFAIRMLSEEKVW